MKLNGYAASQTNTKANKKSSELPIQESKVTMEGRTGTVDLMQELGAWDRAITSKRVHHSQMRRYGKVLPSEGNVRR